MKGPVVYVEDEPDDAFFMERALAQAAPGIELKILTNGQEALQFFAAVAKAQSSAKTRPGLVLLDLNLPGRSGLEVLGEIRSHETLRVTPVIIYTSSNQAVDIAEAYRRGCSAYLVKPGSPAKMRNLVSVLTTFWLKENHYPVG